MVGSYPRVAHPHNDLRQVSVFDDTDADRVGADGKLSDNADEHVT